MESGRLTLKDINGQESYVDDRLSNDLTPEVRGDVGDMNPPSVAFPYQLGKLDAPLPVHLLYEPEQAAVVGPVACYQVGSTAEDMVTVLHAPDERVELLAAVARGYHDGLSPRFADGVKELFYEYVQQVVGTLRWAVVDALAQRGSAGGEFGNGKIFHEEIYNLTIYYVLFIYNLVIWLFTVPR